VLGWLTVSDPLLSSDAAIWLPDVKRLPTLGRLFQFVSRFDLEQQNPPTALHRVCQNTEIRLTRRESGVSEVASHVQEDLMANLWSSAQLLEHFLLLWISR